MARMAPWNRGRRIRPSNAFEFEERMTTTLRLCLVLHNHQPVGNFDHVFEQAYEDAYLPFLDVFESYPDWLRISLHTSGPLMEWIADRRPEYLERLASLVQRGRVEIIGGAFYEPILTMIPARDRIGQIAGYRRWLEDRLGGAVQGMWIPERVWEQSLTRDLVDAGARYTVLDDFHFKNAGLADDQLYGYYLTEDEGRVFSIFPGSERLRYLIPFRDPPETIHYLRGIAQQHPGAVLVCGDDGEKFGIWPETNKHCYHDGWLRRFFDVLERERDWLQVTTLAEAYENVLPEGKIYLPDGSYREMTEWALPVERQHDYDTMVHELEHDERWPRIRSFVRGGFWRNFKVKYPETNEMYARMMMVSRRFQEAEDSGVSGAEFQLARRELYRAQCNCSYWHGAFGGAYLPHLRNGVYNHLIAAENLIDQATGRPKPYVEAVADDYNFDARQEVRLASEKLVCLLAPSAGGQLYELDVRSICHNLLATFARRPEAYHRKVLAGANANGENVASIHERVVFKQEGLDQRIQYDHALRKSLIDHFWDNEAALESIATGVSLERGDFAQGPFETVIRRNPDRIQVLLSRNGNAWGVPLKITKGVTLEAGGAELEIAYLIEGLPAGQTFHFGVEFNFSGMPSGIDDRYFSQGDGQRLGQLGQRLNLQNRQDLGLTDEWLGLSVHLASNRPTDFWAFPIETVSQSEGGFELVHQSVLVQPHWRLTGDKDGRWSVVMKLAIDTTLAESRIQDYAEAAAS
jgi:4-alpha-glucanotransferase